MTACPICSESTCPSPYRPLGWDEAAACYRRGYERERALCNELEAGIEAGKRAARSAREMTDALLAIGRLCGDEGVAPIEAVRKLLSERDAFRRTLTILASHDPSWKDDFLRARSALTWAAHREASALAG